MPTIEIKIKRLHPDTIVPIYAKPGESGMDLCSYVDHDLGPGERKLFPTGLKVEIPKGYEMQIRPRSGNALKHGITVLNTPGTVDSGYRGEVGVILYNSSKEKFRINKGDKIAQGVIAEVLEAKIQIADELSDTVRGAGGFGSTGN